MSNKFKIEEADAAIQEVEVKNRYEHRMQAYAKASKAVEDATDRISEYKNEFNDFSNKMEFVIAKLNKASTIKVTEDAEKLLESFGKVVYNKLLQMFLTEGTKMIGRITKERDNVVLPYRIFYGIVISLVILLMFQIVIIVANTEIFHSSIT